MGFYAPSQLVQDAKRHGVQVRPPDVQYSDWEATLEAASGSGAVRLGLGQISGLSQQAGRRIEEARAQAPFTCLQDLAVRAALDRRDMNALAAANALRSLGSDRRAAQWHSALIAPPGLLRSAPILEETMPALPGLSEGESIVHDYRSLGLTLGRHPLVLLRPQLQARRFVPAAQLQADWPDRRPARACGLVTSRQRP